MKKKRKAVVDLGPLETIADCLASASTSNSRADHLRRHAITEININGKPTLIVSDKHRTKNLRLRACPGLGHGLQHA